MMKHVNDSVLSLAREQVITRRDELLARQADLREERRRLAIQERELDRELADCKATARFFGLDVEFPIDEREEAERQMLVRRRELLVSRLADAAHGSARDEAVRLRSEIDEIEARIAIREARRQTRQSSLLEGAVVQAEEKSQIKQMPRIRDIALDQLRAAGKKGCKASTIKEYIESTYAAEIHEKTVGMTLFRLSKDGAVHRDGHTWFFGPQPNLANADAENPGAAAPGNTQAQH